MHIVIPSFGLGVTGGDRVLTALANGLSKRGHTMTVVNLGRRPPHFPLSKTVDLVSVPMKHGVRRASEQKVAFLLEGMKRLAMTLPPADFYLANMVFTVPPCMSHQKEGKTVFLAQANEIFCAKKPVERLLEGVALQSYLATKHGITPSHYLQQMFHKQFAVDMTVIPPGIDTTRFKPKTKHNKHVKILFSGDIRHPNKGFDLLIGALSFLHAQGMHFELVVATHHLPGRAHFPFLCTFYHPAHDRELIKVYQSADLFCFLSHEEGFGLSLLEAMACGLACITTDSGGIRDFVRDKKNVCLTERDVPSIAKTIASLIENQRLQEALRLAARKTAERYTEERMIDAFERYLTAYSKEKSS